VAPRRRICLAIVLALSVPMTPLATGAQPPPSADARRLKPEELDQLVAPIALYSDAVLAQIFMASTYPLQVIEAARFAKANPTLKGDALNQALKKYPWDDSVKALVSYPQILGMMDEKLDWMQKLGEATLSQQKDTKEAVQRVRARAQQPAQQPAKSQQPAQAYWYYCPSARAYYPTAPSCPEPWVKVPPRAQ